MNEEMRYTVEDADGTWQKGYDRADEALRMLTALADKDGKAILIDHLPSGDVRGFVLTANT